MLFSDRARHIFGFVTLLGSIIFMLGVALFLMGFLMAVGGVDTWLAHDLYVYGIPAVVIGVVLGPVGAFGLFMTDDS